MCTHHFYWNHEKTPWLLRNISDLLQIEFVLNLAFPLHASVYSLSTNITNKILTVLSKGHRVNLSPILFSLNLI